MKHRGRQWESVYNDLLRYQTELSFDLEQGFFCASDAWYNAKNVLDFGSGNAYYSKKLANHYPEKKFFCIDKNPKLNKIAKKDSSSNQVKIISGSLDQLEKMVDIDFVFTRHTLSYLSDQERERFFTWFVKKTNKKSALLVIDADDDAFFVYPPLPLLEGGNKKFQEELKKTGGNRSLLEKIGREWKKPGLLNKWARPLVVHSALSGRKYLMGMFMKAVAEIDHGSPLPEAVREEIDGWEKNHMSYLQYGLFGSLFQKGEKM